MIFLTTPLTTKPNTTRTLGLGAIAALFILTACGGGTPATTTHPRQRIYDGRADGRLWTTQRGI